MQMTLNLPTIRISKTFEFELAHALTGYTGACHNIHGHTYKLAVTVSGKPISDSSNPINGMVMDFSRIKSIVKEKVIDHLDHALALNATDANRFPGIEDKTRVIYFPFAPTCEMILFHICTTISAHLPVQVKLHSVRLHETSTSYAEWHFEDNK